MSKNIESFNRVVAFCLAKSYENFPCIVMVKANECLGLVTYGCDSRGESEDDKLEFIKHCILWLDEEASLIEVNADIRSDTYALKLTIKGLQKLNKTPKSLKQSLGRAIIDSISRYAKHGVNKVVDDGIAHSVDTLMESLV